MNYPSLTATFWMSLFFGPLGFMSADRAAQEAHARGLPTARYWICFVMAWVIGPVLMLAIYFGVPAIAERYDGVLVANRAHICMAARPPVCTAEPTRVHRRTRSSRSGAALIVLPVLFPAPPEAANSKPDKPSPGEVPGPSHD